MSIFRDLWADECGAVLSAELVMVGTLGVVGGTVGLAAVRQSVNDELKECAFAIRSLDQSYSVEGHAGCRAWTAGSCYRQQPVEESLAELQGMVEDAERDAENSGDDDQPRRTRRNRDRDHDDDEDRGARRRNRNRTGDDGTENPLALEESS